MSEKNRDWESIKNSSLVRKSKKGFFQIIFGRSFIVAMLFLFQILFFLYVGTVVTERLFVAGAISTLSFFMIVKIINAGGDISFHLTWVILVGIFPAFGIPLYFMTQLDIGNKIEKIYMNRIISDSIDIVPKQPEFIEKLKVDNHHLYQLSMYTQKTGGYTAYSNTAVRYFPVGEQMIDALEEAILGAKKYIFMEFFIIYKGDVWERILKALIEKVNQGVEVRLIYDGTLDMTALPHDYPSQLEAVGIKCKMFSPLPVLLSFSYNHRDHRKIVVIDGEIGFTGGVNLADEYANITHPLGHWKDTAVELRGEGVLGLNLMFLQMWNAMEDEIVYQPYLQLPKCEERSHGYVLTYSDNPFDEYDVGKNIYLDILNRAEKYVYIMTPYLILDGQMLSAIKFAEQRGVDVRIILPHIPDKKYAFALSVNYYKELIAAGVEIYEYTPGFVHAKMFISDDICATVGTINLDYRSLYLHFENGVYMEAVPAIRDIKRDFVETMEQSRFISRDLARKIHPVYHFFGSILRVIAPLF